MYVTVRKIFQLLLVLVKRSVWQQQLYLVNKKRKSPLQASKVPLHLQHHVPRPTQRHNGD
jgi:hypothetical protein